MTPVLVGLAAVAFILVICFVSLGRIDDLSGIEVPNKWAHDGDVPAFFVKHEPGARWLSMQRDGTGLILLEPETLDRLAGSQEIENRKQYPVVLQITRNTSSEQMLGTIDLFKSKGFSSFFVEVDYN